MVSTRVKDFLINLAIALLLAVPVLVGFYYYKDRIIDKLKRKPSLKTSGVEAVLKTGKKEYHTLFGTVKDKKNGDKILIENEGEEQWVKIDPERIFLGSPEKNGEARVLDSLALSEIKLGSEVTIYDFERDEGEILKGGRMIVWR